MSIPLSKSICHTTFLTVLCNHHLSTFTSRWSSQHSLWCSTSTPVYLIVYKVHLIRWNRSFIWFICMRHLLSSLGILYIQIYLFDLISFFYISILIKVLRLLNLITLYIGFVLCYVWILWYIFLKNILCIFVFIILSLL